MKTSDPRAGAQWQPDRDCDYKIDLNLDFMTERGPRAGAQGQPDHAAHRRRLYILVCLRNSQAMNFTINEGGKSAKGQELRGGLIMLPIVVGLSAFLFGIEAPAPPGPDRERMRTRGAREGFALIIRAY